MTPASRTLAAIARRYAALLESVLAERLISVVLFGSAARGDATPSSDIDLLIIAGDLPAGQFARKRLLADADAELQADLDAAAAAGIDTRLARIVRTPEEARRFRPLYLDMTEDAQILFDRDHFFTAVLDSLRASLRRSGAQRLRMGRTWYWDLKPDFVCGDVVTL